jgi:thiol-disulfide isomerase/thioredoxin
MNLYEADTMRCATIGLVLLTLSASADEAAKESAAAVDYKKLSAEWQDSVGVLRAEYVAQKAEELIDDMAKNYRAKVRKVGGDFAVRFLALAEKYPQDPVAVDALIRAAQLGTRSEVSEKALTVLGRDHLDDPKMAGLCSTLAYSKWQGADKLLAALMEKHSRRDVRAQACFSLAKRYREQAAAATQPEEREKAVKNAEALYQTVVAKYADVAFGRNRTLGPVAQTALDEIQRLAVGRPAPEIDGLDVDGKAFKLSDYRGKVVVLDFWGHWCPDCRGVYPEQKALVARYQDRPFALLGVNSDKDKDVLRKVLAQRGVTWRYWWDGGATDGPIATAWNIEGWPTIYVIDHKGVIRAKGHEELAEKLPALVDALVKDAEADAKRK